MCEGPGREMRWVLLKSSLEASVVGWRERKRDTWEMGLERAAGPGNAGHLRFILSVMDAAVGLGRTVMGPDLF